jgi:3-oxoisoapionate kinase
VSRDLLLTYYGDDFTGSTDVLEALTVAGIPGVLFLDPPHPADLDRFPDARAVGVAGTSRGMSPTEMHRALPQVFRRLRELGAPLLHYKVCSTFDSSPEIGSIGLALDLGARSLEPPFVPIVVGAPILGRYCAFGNLFARSGLESEVYRLDRHPTMARHPATPMDESDLRRVLARQTGARVGLLDLVDLHRAPQQALDGLLASGAEAVLFDVLTEGDLPVLGDLIWSRCSRNRPLFAVGSSGLEYALAAAWRRQGSLPPPPRLGAEPVDQVAVVSGSCSPVTERQIAHAVDNGFAEVAVIPAHLVSRARDQEERARVFAEASAALHSGLSVILHTARGPDDPRIAATRSAVSRLGLRGAELRHHVTQRLGLALGGLLADLMREFHLKRGATTGGDTSSYIARGMDIRAVEVAAPCAPGSPFCRLHAPDTDLDGREIVFKGGQVGTVDFFRRVLSGTGTVSGASP